MADKDHLKLLTTGAKNWNVWREDNPWIKPDFTGATLIGGELQGANLLRADFSQANLTGANLSEAILNRANFTGCILRGVKLGGANLSQAVLTGADLREAIFGWTLFANNDLSAVIGLQTCLHEGPSTLGIDTLYKSGGVIPEAFLRGCGVPEGFITYARSLVGKAIDFYSCFISYSHEDKSFARRLHDQLQSRGIRCWLDEHQLLPGHDIYDEVDRGIRLWDKVLLCCSKDSLSSWWVDKEISTAFDKEQKLWKERSKKTLALIPLNLDGYLLSGQWQSGKAHPIMDRLAADFTGWETDNAKFEHEFERLVKALRADGSDREAPPTPKL
jgi:Uncharacterized low-complexity proteins